MDFKNDNEKKKENSDFAKDAEQPLEDNNMNKHAQPVLPAEPIVFVKPKKNFNLELPLSEEESGLEAVRPENELPIESGNEEEEEEEPAKGGCLKTIIGTAIVVGISILLALVILNGLNDMLGLYKPDKQIDVKIKPGLTVAGISKELKKDNVIMFDWEFNIYAKLSKVTGLQHGTFSLNSDMGYSDIVKVLKDPTNNKESVNVTFPEGYTILQIAKLLEDKKVCKSKDFINILEGGTLKFKYSSLIPANKDRYYSLEGYLFPDTYKFYLSETPTEVATIMLDNFSSKMNSIDLINKAKKINMTTDQVITLASIIQAEASNTAEMSNVSSVFHNRLEKGTDSLKFLQSDATILYITRSLKAVLTQSDTEVKTAYNTYLHEGLPPGAINNPGLAAINAALSPASTKYFYFVTDVNNKYYYSETFAQHQKAVKKALATGTAMGTDTVNK